MKGFDVVISVVPKAIDDRIIRLLVHNGRASFAEIAGMRGLSERTVQRRWAKARIYLHHSIRNATVP